MKKPSKAAPSKPYGFVLVLRGLASAAIRLHDRPAALRVLCVAAEYMNQDGVCKISQDTIAARLDITRQAVNKHLAELDRMEILCSDANRDGILKSYYLDMEGLEDERFGQDRVDARRKTKREARRGQFDPANLKLKGANCALSDAEQTAHDAVSDNLSETRTSSPLPRDIRARDRVHHAKLGFGVVDEYFAGGNQVLVHFDHGVGRTVVTSFLTLCTEAAPHGGATQ